MKTPSPLPTQMQGTGVLFKFANVNDVYEAFTNIKEKKKQILNDQGGRAIPMLLIPVKTKNEAKPKIKELERTLTLKNIKRFSSEFVKDYTYYARENN